MAARWAHNPEVVGSNPTPATKTSALGRPRALVLSLDGTMLETPSPQGRLRYDHRATKVPPMLEVVDRPVDFL